MYVCVCVCVRERVREREREREREVERHSFLNAVEARKHFKKGEKVDSQQDIDIVQLYRLDEWIHRYVYG